MVTTSIFLSWCFQWKGYNIYHLHGVALARISTSRTFRFIGKGWVWALSDLRHGKDCPWRPFRDNVTLRTEAGWRDWVQLGVGKESPRSTGIECLGNAKAVHRQALLQHRQRSLRNLETEPQLWRCPFFTSPWAWQGHDSSMQHGIHPSNCHRIPPALGCLPCFSLKSNSRGNSLRQSIDFCNVFRLKEVEITNH